MIYQPRDQSDIYLRAMESRVKQMQNNPFAQALPGAVNQVTQNLTAVGAHKNITDYLSLPDEEKAKPENKQKFYQSALLLGVDPSKFIAQKVDPLTLESKKQEGRVAIEGMKESAKSNQPPMTRTIRRDPEQFNEQRLTSLGNELDPTKSRGGAFGVSKQVFDRAERLETLASAFKNNNLDKRQIEELAIGLNSMLSGANVGAQEQVKALVPNTIIGNGMKMVEWLTNEPTGTNQQAFVQRMLGSIGREKATAATQLKRSQFQKVQRYADLEKSNPDAFYSVLQSQGVDPEEYKAWRKSGFKAISAVQTPDDSKSQKIGRFEVQVH